MTTRPDTTRPVPPTDPQRIARLEPLTGTELEELGHRGEVESASLDGVDLSHRDLRGGSWSGATVSGSLAGSDLSDAFITDVSFDRLDGANLVLGRASIVRTAFHGGRLLGVSFPEALLQDVTFDDVQLDLASMRFTRLQRVVFRNCRMHEFDLSNSSFQSVLFDGCDLTGADFSKTSFERCELRGCTLDEARGIHDLTGVAMTLLDVVELAPLFASAMGITIVD